MQEGVLKIRRWVATVVVLVALAAGGILSQELKNWTGHSVLGAAKTAPTIATDGAPVNLGNFANGFSAVLKPALPGMVVARVRCPPGSPRYEAARDRCSTLARSGRLPRRSRSAR